MLSTYEHFDSESSKLITHADELSVTGLTCRTPVGDVLFSGLTFRVQRGQHLLIMGPSGCGELQALVACLLLDLYGVFPLLDCSLATS